jgi:uncharacterized protein (TIGR00304 family)
MPDLVLVGVAIILAGFFLVFLATILSGKESRGDERESRVRGGGVVLIGPIPIVFGSDAKWASAAIVLAILLMLIVLFSGILVKQ